MRTKTIILILLLLQTTLGIGNAWATVGIKSLGYKTDFASTSEPFDKGDIVTTNGNIGSVLRVFNTTSRAYFNEVHTLRTNETVSISFTAYHGYLGSTNQTSSVSVLNSNGVVLIGYTYNHTSGRITDVKIGGSTVLGFEEFDAISHYNIDQNANGIDGNGKPYRNGSGTYNPKITMQISENGTVMFNLYLSNKAIDKTIWGNIGSAANNLGCIEITSNCENSDRTICIDDLEISTNYYSQNYESGTIDWTTANSDRFTPVILDEGGNKYLSVDQGTRNNNGTVLTRPSFNIAEGTDYNMSFDLKVSSSTNQGPVSFTVYDKLGSDVIFSLTATGTWSTDWKVNNGTQINLPNTNKGNSSNTITDVPWYTISLTRRGSTTHVTIKNKEGWTTYFDDNVTSSSTGGLGKMEFITCRYLANFAIDNIEVTPLPTWSASNATVDITNVGATDPNVVADYLPYLKEHRYEISTYSSSNTNVASFWPGNQLLIKGIGTTTITATDTQGNSALYNLTVTGTTVAPVINGNMLTFSEPGIIMNNTEKTTKSHTLPKGLTVSYGYSDESIGETAIVVSSVSGSVLKVIDNNGYSRPNLGGNGVPYEGIYGGTFVKLEATANGYMVLTGNVSSTKSKLYKNDGTAVETEIDESEHTLAASLTGGSTYYLYNLRTIDDATDGVIVPMINSISYVDAYFARGYEVIPIPTDANHSTTIQTVKGLANPTYTIECQGDVGNPTISGTTISGIEGGGAIKVTATDGYSSLSYIITVAYEAIEYPGQLWDFYSVEKGLTTTDALKEVPDPNNASTNTQTGIDGSTWKAEWKNANTSERPEWYRQSAVNGDNAFIVPETAGLVFVNGARNFYMRNDEATFSHIGIRGYGGGTTFTIPFLKEGDIVELMWRHDASGSGSKFTATNLKDLRGKDVNEVFEITESAYRTIRKYVGAYSFIVANDGDVSFTLQDNGNCDIQSIRIYKGPYRSTMRSINLSDNTPAPTTMLLDNVEQSHTYNYCNQLYSTATGPAMYVLKGYRPKVNDSQTLGVDYDHEGCVKGSNASKTPVFFTDADAYPVSDAEKIRLYELRKNIIGLEIYNNTWQSSRNSYNNGVIKATSGWGKVTIRMNNYTNDLKYVIGYTPDYTLTIGSAPHQKYPYTWDFTKIAGQNVTGAADNVLYSIEAEGSNANFSGAAPTNWFKNENGQYMLNTDNSEDIGSQYVPGAVLVTQDCALSNFNGVDYDAKWAKDELDGLGFDGAITMHIDHLPSDVTSGWNRAAVADMREPMLSFHITDYATFIKTGGTEDDPTGTWSNPATVKEAGNGWIQVHNNVSIDESSIPHGGIGCRLDDGDTKYIHVIPSSPLQAGDIISVTAYNAYNNREAGISFNKSDSKSNVAQSKMLSGKLVEETIDYTVATNDGLDGLSDFYIYRHENTVHITAIEITRSASAVPNLDWSIYTLTNTTITVPDLNADGKQDWIYVSASAEPESVTNATKVTDGTDGPDANTDVYKYKVTDPGNSDITFATGTKIYKIGVTHLLKEIHPVGGTGWATEIRNQDIDHELIGYFTKNDVNAYAVTYDSYDLNTATVALTPINEDGYVPNKTGIVMKLDNVAGLSDANGGKNVPLFYPSYTRPATTTPVDFPTNNMMYQDANGIDSDNTNANETYSYGDKSYQKFILTNVHWTFHQGTTAADENETNKIVEEDAAGFYRMHIWGTDAGKNVMPAHTAFLLVPIDELPVAVWNLPSAARRRNTIAIRTAWGEETTAIDDIELTPGMETDKENTAEDGEWYTLSGVRLPKRPIKPGLYICDGKKVVIKLKKH